MADAFRGLTIRLGADARPLNSAISSVKNSAAAAQKQMNLLNKALKFDTTNASLMQSKLDLMGDKATHSARAFEKIRQSMRQTTAAGSDLLTKIGKTSSEFKTLVNDTKEAYAATQKVRDELFTVDASLQHIYDDAAKAAKSMKEFKTVEQAAEFVKMLRKEIRDGGKDQEWAEQKLREYIEHAAGLKGVAEKFGLVKGEGKKLVEVYDELISHHNRLQTEQEALNAVEGYRAARYNAQAFAAEVRQAVSETTRLRTEMLAMGKGGRLSRAINEIKRYDDATEQAVADAHKMIEAQRAYPTSMNAAVAKIRAVAAAEETLKVKTESISAAMKKIEADPAFDRLAASSKRAYVEAVKVEQEYTDLNVKLKMVTGLLDGYNKQLNSMNDRKVDKTSKEYVQCEANIAKCERRQAELNKMIAAMDDSHAAAALTTQYHRLETQLADTRIQAASLHSQVSKLRGLGGIGKGFREFGFGMYASLTPAIMMAGRYAIQAARDVDSAYRDMRKTVNGTEEDFEHLKEAAIEFSRTHVTSADTMLEIEAMGGQLGIQVHNLEAFAHTVSNLDIATNMESDTIAEQLGKMASVMDITVDEYDNFGDALVRLGNNMPVMEGDIMNMTIRYMGMGKVVGMTADQMLGWSTAAIATGQRAEAAGSSMQRFISKVETAVVQGGDSLDGFAKVAGMTSEEFQKAFHEDASAALYEFIQGLGRIQKEGGSVNQVLGELKFGNVRDKQLLEGLAQQAANAQGKVNLLADALEMSSDAYNGMATEMSDGAIEEAGDAAREAEKKSEGFSGELDKMINNAKALAVEFGDASVPALMELGSAFKELTSFVHSLPSEFKLLIVKGAALLAVIGPLAVGFGTFFTSIERIANFGGSIGGFFTQLTAKINPLGTGLETASKKTLMLSRAFTVFSSAGIVLGVTAAITVIAALGDAISKSIKHQGDFNKATKGMVDIAKKSALGAEAKELDGYGKAADSAATSVDELVESTANLVDTQNDRIDTTKKDIGQLKTALLTIERYANTDMSGNVAAQGQFRAAVDLVNEKCGTQYKILDQVNGKLADEEGHLVKTTGAISDYIREKEAQIRADQLSAQISETSAQLDVAVGSWVAAEKRLADIRQTMSDDPLNASAYADEAAKLEREANEAREIVDSLNKSLEIDKAALGAVAANSDDATRSVRNMALANSTLGELFKDNNDELEDFSRQLESAGMTVDEFYDIDPTKWGEAVMAWRNGGYEISAAMDSLGLKVRSLSSQYKLEMESAQGSTKAWQNALETTGMKSGKLAKALDGAGISASQFAQIGSAAFDALWQSSNGDFGKIQQEISLLSTAGIDLGSIKVDDGQLKTAQGLAIELDGDLAHIGDREFKWNVDTSSFEEVKVYTEETTEELEDGAEMTVDTSSAQEEVSNLSEDVESAKAAIEEGVQLNISAEEDASVQNFLTLIDELKSIGSIGVSTSITVDASGIDGAMTSWGTLKEAVSGGINGSVKINADSADTASKKVGNVSTAVKNLNGKDVKINATGNALSVINTIKEELRTMTTYKEITIHTKRTSSGKSAAGAIVPANAAGGFFPRNAEGGINGIVTKAMLTNIGWVGEAGAEALLHMKNAGGAVVPLSNRRYVRPFARAVAGEIGGGSTSSVVNNVTVRLQYDSSTEARKLARDVADELNAILAMGA